MNENVWISVYTSQKHIYESSVHNSQALVQKIAWYHANDGHAYLCIYLSAGLTELTFKIKYILIITHTVPALINCVMLGSSWFNCQSYFTGTDMTAECQQHWSNPEEHK